MTPTPEDLRLAQEWRNTLIQSELKHLDTFRAEARREAESDIDTRVGRAMREEREACERIAAPVLQECLSDYSHPNFTDRHGTADRLRDALRRLRERAK